MVGNLHELLFHHFQAQSAEDITPTATEAPRLTLGEDGLVDPDTLPPPPPSLMYPTCCTCHRADGRHSPNCGVPPGRESPDLPPPPPEHVLSSMSRDSSDIHPAQRRHSAPNVPPVIANPSQTETRTNPPIAPKPPKSILKGSSKISKSKSKSKSAMKKSISFSENVALIVCKDDAPEEEIDYVAYVNSLNKQMKGAQDKKPKPEARTGYDSDFDDDTSDSVSSIDANNETSHCNLCQKKMVEAMEVYCQDCHSYMARFQPGQEKS